MEHRATHFKLLMYLHGNYPSEWEGQGNPCTVNTLLAAFADITLSSPLNHP